MFRYRDPRAFAIGLRELRLRGLTPRGLLFLALDPRGEIYVAIPENIDDVAVVRIGEKLSLVPPWAGRFYHLDAVHRLPGDAVLWNGDRRLSELPTAAKVAAEVAAWLKGSSAKNVFLGCAPHGSGSWWARTGGAAAEALHEAGFVDCVVTTAGVLARRPGEPQLFFLGFAALARHGALAGWAEVFRSELGAILLLERRVLQQRLVLTCEHGLLELDVGHLPDLVIETARVQLRSAFGVVGRVDGGAFAVTTGTVDANGLSELSPAMLVGSASQGLADLPRTLRAQAR
ncbi:MAG: hypothetical protein R3B48_09515 [Kofleriaceae bacterium]